MYNAALILVFVTLPYNHNNEMNELNEFKPKQILRRNSNRYLNIIHLCLRNTTLIPYLHVIYETPHFRTDMQGYTVYHTTLGPSAAAMMPVIQQGE